MAADDPFHHVRDFPYFEVLGGKHIDLPKVTVFDGIAHDHWLVTTGLLNEAGQFVVTKFMVLQVVAAACTLFVAWGLARRAKGGKPVKGRFWNFWESIVLYLRDHVVRSSIGIPHHDHDHDGDGHNDFVGTHTHDGVTHTHDEHEDDHAAAPEAAPGLGGHVSSEEPAVVHTASGEAILAADHHPADKYLPFILTCFFYILFCNLLGAIPGLGTATGSISVTLPLALFVLGFVIYCGSKVSGVAGFWKSLAPGLDLPGPAKLVIGGIIWVIEFVGLFIKHLVLAVRLFANMMAGHTVLGVILGFIAMAASANTAIYATVTGGSIFGQLFVGLLELFVAFLQAYVFSFLAALFVSAAVNPH